ncbi:MAG: hypothetical protein ACRDO4_17505 [Nocardioides sp.]
MLRTALITALLVTTVATASPAAASTSTVVSQPNGDVRLTVSVGCGGTDRDHDGDFNTCGKGDTASLLHAVFNQSDTTQTFRVDTVLDGPGTTFDRTTSIDVVLAPDQIYDVTETFRVENKRTPLGQYTLSVTASASETVATSASLTVH